MPLIVPPSVVKPFGFGAGGGFIQNPLPFDTQIPANPGRASYTDGFTPLNMTALTSGGIPPAGKDMNGVAFAATAHSAWVAAGMHYSFNPDVVAHCGGYPVGAILVSATNKQRFYYNLNNANTNDPDSVLTGWVVFNPLSNPVGHQLDTISAPLGSTDVTLNEGVGFYDINSTGGDLSIQGFDQTEPDGPVDGKILIATNLGTTTITLLAESGLTTPINRMRLPADISLLQNSSFSLRYSVSIGRWIPL